MFLKQKIRPKIDKLFLSGKLKNKFWICIVHYIFNCVRLTITCTSYNILYILILDTQDFHYSSMHAAQKLAGRKVSV